VRGTCGEGGDSIGSVRCAMGVSPLYPRRLLERRAAASHPRPPLSVHPRRPIVDNSGTYPYPFYVGWRLLLEYVSLCST